MKETHHLLRRPHIGALLAALFSLLVLFPAWYLLGNWYEANLVKQERAKASEQLSAHANALASAVDKRISLLQGVYAFTRTEWPESGFDQLFETYSSGIFFNSTGVRTIMIAPEGIARYIFPIFDAPVLSGFDILNAPDPGTRNDVQRAIITRAITLSQPGELPQGGFGMTAWQAVYRGTDLWGLVSISIDMDTVLEDSGLDSLTDNMTIALRDRVGHTFFGPSEVWQQDPVTQSISLSEGYWDLGGVPAVGWKSVVRGQADVFRIGSLLIAGLIALLVYLSVNRQEKLQQAVETRTKQIAAAQTELETRMLERTRELASLQAVSRQIGSNLALEPLLKKILLEIKPVMEYSHAWIFSQGEIDELGLISEAGDLFEPGDKTATSRVQEEIKNEVVSSLKPLIGKGITTHDSQLEHTSWLGVPLIVKDRLIGVLALLHKTTGYYRDEHKELALAFSQQVAVAIENARLYEQAGRLAVLEERQRLARELHDSVSQVLYSIGLGTRSARTALEKDPSQIADALDYVNRLAEAGQDEMRALIFELRPESLRTDGLLAALEKQAAVLRTRHQMEVALNLCPEPELPLAKKETLYRISQEAIHNIVKHARATRVSILLECNRQHCRLEISDNGVGFDPQGDYPGHLGLKSMRERALQSNGTLRIESGSGKGTRIVFIIPMA